MTLGDALDGVLGGGTPSRRVPEFWGGEIPWATVKDLKAPRLSATEEHITSAGLQRSSARLVPRGTVVVATRMAVGRVAWTDVEVAINQDLKALIAGSTLHPRFLFHFMVAKKAWLESIGTGTTVNGISLETVREVPLRLPPEPEQLTIASILDAIDEAIERTEAAIAATELLRQALLHELLTRGLPGRHTEWKHVPDIGTVPACWGISPLEAVLREPIRNGQSMVAPSSETGRWQFTLGAVTFSGLDPTAIKPAPVENRSAALLEIGDLLISRSNTRERVGLVGIYRGVPDACTYPDLLMRLRVDGEVALTEFVEAVLLSPHGRNYFERRARGTSGTMVKITGGIAAAFPFARPSLAEQRGIVDIADGIARVLGASAHQLASLLALKQAASDALLSGHLRVKGTIRPAVMA